MHLLGVFCEVAVSSWSINRWKETNRTGPRVLMSPLPDETEDAGDRANTHLDGEAQCGQIIIDFS